MEPFESLKNLFNINFEDSEEEINNIEVEETPDLKPGFEKNNGLYDYNVIENMVDIENDNLILTDNNNHNQTTEEQNKNVSNTIQDVKNVIEEKQEKAEEKQVEEKQVEEKQVEEPVSNIIFYLGLGILLGVVLMLVIRNGDKILNIVRTETSSKYSSSYEFDSMSDSSLGFRFDSDIKELALLN